LIWDLRRGLLRLHLHAPDPLESIGRSPLHLVSAAPWKWPWRLGLTNRIELVLVDV
jgi:hypothetical protein